VMLKLFDGESDTPELIWNSSMRTELRTVLSEQLDKCLASRIETGEDRFSLPSGVVVKYKSLSDELFIGGVYLSRFLKEPTYNLRDPTTFLEMVMQRWTHEIQIYFCREPVCEEKEPTPSALVDASQGTRFPLRQVGSVGIHGALSGLRGRNFGSAAVWFTAS
jgi:hypothetical protein